MLVLGLAALIQVVERRLAREWVLGVLAAFVVWNLCLVGAYRSNDIPQGIPDPWRVVDEPLTFTGLVATGLQVVPAYANPAWRHWLRDGWFTGRAARAVAFTDIAQLATVVALLLALGALGWLVVRTLLARRRGERGMAFWAVASALLLTVLLHVVISAAASRGAGFGHFHAMPEVEFQVSWPAEDTWVYSDYGEPVTAVDLLTRLTYAHGVPEGAIAAMVTVFGRDGRSYTKLLRAGVDTAEASYLREEFRDAIRHDIDEVRIVRTAPTDFYSRRSWEALTCHSVLRLPEPTVVTKIRFRYVHPVGRLVVSDVFLRDF
jgi:hypothetical protein